MNELDKRLETQIAKLKEEGTYKESLYLTAPMAPTTQMEGHGEVVVLSSNNYLGLADHPQVKEAGIEAIKKYGAGTASVRFICGSFDIHRQLEEKIASFLKMEAALSFVACWNANTGLLATLAEEGDVLISDELNHASIIDACRLAGKKVGKKVFKHSDMNDLKTKLEECKDQGHVFIISDGVFSMEGDIAKLPELVQLSKEYGATLIIDDSHGTGVLGKRGAGVAEHYDLEGEVDIITSTLGKALGGAAGGFVSGRKSLIEMLFQKSRPMLFSNALPPTVAASSLAAIEVLDQNPGLVEKLHANTKQFREGLLDMGYKPLDGESAIIPIIVGETSKAISLSKKLLEKGVFVTGFGFPVVPEGTARIRLQMSAALEQNHIKLALDTLESLKSEI